MSDPRKKLPALHKGLTVAMRLVLSGEDIPTKYEHDPAV